MKIAIFTTVFPSASETFVIEHANELIRRGYEVDIYSLDMGKTDTQLELTSKYKLLERHTALLGKLRERNRVVGGMSILYKSVKHSPFLFRCARQFVKALLFSKERVLWLATIAAAVEALESGLKKKEYDLVHAHFGPAGVIAERFKRWGIFRAPLITTFHGYDVNTFPGQHTDPYKKLFAGGEAFTANSEWLVEKLRALGAPPDKVFRVPIGVSLEALSFRGTREREGEVRILTVARLIEVKGIRFAVEALSYLPRETLQQVRYVILGGGELELELKKLIEDLRLSDIVEMRGEVDWSDVVAELYSSDLFMLPGIRASNGAEEAQGKVLLEAQAVGLPVISTVVGGIPETVAAGAGILVRPKDPRAIAEAMERLLDEPESWKGMGRKGREHVESEYALDLMISRFEEIYKLAREQKK